MLLIVLTLGVAAIVVYDGVVLTRALVVGSRVAAESTAFSSEPAGYHRALLVVGDSTAVGTGASDPALTIAGRIGADFPRLRVDNRGVNGALTADVIGQIESATLPAYDAVLIQVGGNDALRLTTADALREQMRGALEAAFGLAPRVAIMSTGNLSEAPALPWPLEHLFGWRARVVRDLFAALAGQHGARYVNLFTAPGDPNPFLESPRTYYARDFLHPSGAGYGVWYPKLRAQVPLHDWLGGT